MARPLLRPLNLPWRRPAIESGPIRLGARRLFILPTRSGLVFTLLLFGLLIGAMNYGLALAYLFTFLLAGLGVAGLIHTQRNLMGLTLRPGAVAPVFAGEAARFVLHLDNPSRLARYRIGIQPPDAAPTFCDVPALGQAELAFNLPQARRGLHRPGRLTLFGTYPLGLFRCWAVFELDWGVLVYPRPAPDGRPFPEAGGADQAGRTARPGNEEFDGLREYRLGDPPRRIAWKAAARRGRPVTKAFSTPAGQSLWLDWQATPEADPEARLSRLTRWVLDAEAAGLAYGLRLPGHTLAPGRGEANRRQALERLALHGAP